MERDTLLTPRKDEDITILPADKGIATVVLLSEDYHNKIKTVLSDPIYTKLTLDPTEQNRETNTLPHKEFRHPGRGRQEAEPPCFSSTQTVWATEDT
jgi:hypothetical protein